MNVHPKPFEIFCGTGGVGKTTLATSRALHLASLGKRVLLITIDPSKRLKEVLNLSEENAGKLEIVKDILGCGKSDFHLHALLMDPGKTLERMAQENQQPDLTRNRIIKILGRPYAGMNEILALLEVQHHLAKGEYDTVVLDTPPGKHFLDFLEACEKINIFFDKSFIDVFRYVGRRRSGDTSSPDEKRGILKAVVSSGVKTLLKQLEKVTGGQFLTEFIEAVGVLYDLKAPFLQALELEERIKLKANSNWFLVTSVEHHKMAELEEMREHAQNFMHEDSYIALNKCLSRHSESWKDFSESSTIGQLKASLLTKEVEIKRHAQLTFKKVLDFDEIFSSSPADQVSELCRQWERFSATR